MDNETQSHALDQAALARDCAALTALGARPLGSPAELRAREYVSARLRELGLPVKQHEFPYLGWELTEAPVLEITAPRAQRLDALAFTYSSPTPPDGVSGTLELVGQHWVIGLHRWAKYRIADGDGRTVGYVSGRPDGPAVEQPLAEGASPLPHFIVGAEDLGRLRAIETSGEAIAVAGTIAARLDPRARGCNLTAHLPGPGPAAPRIAVCAHLDSMRAPEPGGADGARGVAALLALARSYATIGPASAIDFLVFTGNEWDMAGSKAYVADRAQTSAVDGLSLAIDLETFAEPTGELQIWSGPEALEVRLQSVVDSFIANRAPDLAREYKCPAPPAGDHMPFVALGIPTVTLTAGQLAPPAAGGATLGQIAELARQLVEGIDATAELESKRGLLAANRATTWEHSLSLKQY